ncbi:hypothetical protein [Polaribacter porphyrae]|uniref:Uncharacterized protein n=1 Tax=Polaribacter porphyrae TaxID=1137780 RepID=A0A2S7WRT1_9FLAO|nr:hypothetical protein [Polaribacter porphyrae]PQJ80308.1 hypothetical protein BTO18_14485 [Polaribacter porphyrae]
MKFRFFVFNIFIILSCGNSTRTNESSIESYKQVSIEKIIKTPSDYHNKNIEITGYFYFSMEDSSISSRKKSNFENRVWLDFNFFKDLKI